jgi:hypothetical protein
MSNKRTYVVVDAWENIVARCEAWNYYQAARKLRYGSIVNSCYTYKYSENCYTLETLARFTKRSKCPINA